MSEQITVFHHNDPDGYCAAEWLERYLKVSTHDTLNNDCPRDYHEFAYGEFDWTKVKNNSTVFFLDCSVPPSVFEKLEENGCRVIWIDHHITAINKVSEAGLMIDGYQDIKNSGCELTRMWCEDQLRPHTVYSQIVSKYIEDFDLWKHTDPNSNLFVQGLCSEPYQFGAPVWDKLFVCGDYENHLSSRVKEVIGKGQAIVNYIAEQSKMALKRASWEINLKGYKCLVLNCPLPGSQWTGEKFPQYDCVMVWCMGNPGKISASLYAHDTTKIHVGEIASQFGGGGHPGAAGFTMDTRSFMKLIKG